MNYACGDAQNSTNEIKRNSLIKSCIAAWRVRTIIREFNTVAIAVMKTCLGSVILGVLLSYRKHTCILMQRSP